MSQPLRYVVISPVKDEAHLVESTLRAMVNQSRKPVRWVIVDDGSSDGTLEILRRYSCHPFISIIETRRSAPREPGTGVIRAFERGYETTRDLEFDVVVKLDCDLEFEPEYFEKLLSRMEQDFRLGIISGVYRERNTGGGWQVIQMPKYHAAGACKVIRRKCFEEIGGFVCSRGWDTVDEIRAMNLGWKTTHFDDLVMSHLKPEGSGIGSVRTCILHGEVYYKTGGGLIFFAAKFLHRVFQKPPLLGAVALAYGYLRPLVTRQKLLVTDSEATLYNGLLLRRLFGLQN